LLGFLIKFPALIIIYYFIIRLCHLKYVGLEERDEQHGDGDQLTDVLEPIILR